MTSSHPVGGSGVVALKQSALPNPEPEQSMCVKPPPTFAECCATVPSGREITPGKIHCVSSKQSQLLCKCHRTHPSGPPLFSECKQMLSILLIILGYCIILSWCQAIRGSNNSLNWGLELNSKHVTLLRGVCKRFLETVYKDVFNCWKQGPVRPGSSKTFLRYGHNKHIS